MEFMTDEDRADGDGEGFEIFSNVLTKKVEREKAKEMQMWKFSLNNLLELQAARSDLP